MDVHTHVGRTRPFLVEWFAAAGGGQRVLRAVGRRLIVRARARKCCRHGVAFVCATVTAFAVGGKGGVGSMESSGACAKRRFDGHARRRLVATTRTRTGLFGPPLSFVNDASSSSATIHRRENRLWCSALSLVPMAAGPDDRSSPPYRHNIPCSACRLRTAAVRLRRLCGRRSADQLSSHRFASASGLGRWRDGFYTTRARCTPAAEDAAAGSQFVPRRRSSFEKYYVSRRRPLSPLDCRQKTSVFYGFYEMVGKKKTFR